MAHDFGPFAILIGHTQRAVSGIKVFMPETARFFICSD